MSRIDHLELSDFFFLKLQNHFFFKLKKKLNFLFRMQSLMPRYNNCTWLYPKMRKAEDNIFLCQTCHTLTMQTVAFMMAFNLMGSKQSEECNYVYKVYIYMCECIYLYIFQK